MSGPVLYYSRLYGSTPELLKDEKPRVYRVLKIKATEKERRQCAFLAEKRSDGNTSKEKNQADIINFSVYLCQLLV